MSFGYQNKQRIVPYLNNINFVTEVQCVFYEAGTKFMNSNYVVFWVQIANENFLATTFSSVNTATY
jgi:hypothetical protein